MTALVNKKLLFILSAFLFALFVLFSYLVAKETFLQFDFDTTVKFQDNISRRFDYPFSILSIIGSVEVTFLICGMLFFFLILKRFILAALALFLLPFALILEIYGKLFVYHPGPPYLFYRGVLDFNFPSHYIHTDYAYPSGHMLRTTFVVIFLMTYFYLRVPKRWQLFIQPLLIIYVILMFISRIYLGEHWFSDVIGGLLLGASTGILAGLFTPLNTSDS